MVGGGPAGLEAGLTLARRGFEVAIAEAGGQFGGRLNFEARLPGLNAWHRVIDYRLGQLKAMNHVALYPASLLTAEDVLDFGADHVVLATGSRWLADGYSPNEHPAAALTGEGVMTPDDIAADMPIEGPVVVFDFDSYYMGERAGRASGAARACRHLCHAGGVRRRLDHQDQRAAADACLARPAPRRGPDAQPGRHLSMAF